MASSRTVSLLEDPILALFLKLSPAGILGMLIIGIYNTVDGVFVGRIVGPDGLTAVTLSLPLVLGGSSFSGLVGVGAASLYSRLIGSGDRERSGRVLLLVTLLNLLLWALFLASVLPFVEPLLRFLGATDSTIGMAKGYALIVLSGTIFANLMSSVNMLIRAEGRMNSAMSIMAVGAVINCALDPVLMLAFDMGVAGAAWATVLSQALSALVGYLYYASGRGAVKPVPGLGRGWMADAREILAVGFSAMALPVLNLLQYAVILRAAAVYAAPEDLAVIGAASRIMQMIIIPVWGACTALQPLAGTNYGAGNHARVRRAFAVFSVCATAISTLLWLLVSVFARSVLGWFLPGGAILDRGAGYLRLYLLTFPFLGFMMMTLTLFQSTGKALIAAVLTIGKFLAFFVPALLLLGPALGARGVFLSPPVADLCTIVVGSCALAYLVRRRGYLRGPDSRKGHPIPR